MVDKSNYLFLSQVEHDLVNKIKDTSKRLGFCVLLKHMQHRGFFPKKMSEIPLGVVTNLAEQLEINPKLFREYKLSGRTSRRHQQEIREFLGFRNPQKKDRAEVSKWLFNELSIENEMNDFVVAAQQRFLELKICMPNDSVIKEVAASAFTKVEDKFFRSKSRKIPKAVKSSIDRLINGKGELDLSELKQDPGRVGMKSLQKEADKLRSLRELNLPSKLFAGISKKQLIKLKRRVASESVFEVNRHPHHKKFVLFAAYSYVRVHEITDDLVELLIQIVHKIGARAEKKVIKEWVKGFKKVRNKEGVFRDILSVSLKNPKGQIDEIIYPTAGGEEAMQNILKELGSGPIYRIKVQNTMRASYVHHYRRMIPIILEALEFCSNNTRYKPVIEAIELIKKYQDSTKKHYSSDDNVPIDGVVKREWMSFVIQDNGINRANYELALLDSLRNRLRCKEIWVPCAFKYCNPDEDLPQDFSKKKVEYFDKLKADLNPYSFVKHLENQMRDSLNKLNANIPNNPDVKILSKKGGWISVSPLGAQDDPQNLIGIKKKIQSNWPMTGLLDVLKETELRVGFTKKFETVGVRATMKKDVLQRRLLLALYGLGTNMGLKRVCTTTTKENHHDLTYVKGRYINRDNLRNAIAEVANAIFKVRMPHIWGEGTTSCASDSKKFGSWDQNLMTEWHIRYRGRGVMIYWHVDKKSTCIYSQLKSCSSSEVAAMIEGLLQHNTTMEIDKNYVDSHGQSEVAFAFCHLLGFKLMPRLKAINKQKLYLPKKGESSSYQNLKDVLTRPIKWDLIINQYDEMIKHVAALKLGYADAETILKRFTRNNLKHPTYLAFCELGKVVKTLFLCEYLSSRELRQEINEGLNVVENWNSANGFLFFGKNSEISTNSVAEQELSVLALHLLQISMVYVNTIMIQQVLSDDTWLNSMTDEDFRALTPLIYAHINPYGSFNLDMAERLPLVA